MPNASTSAPSVRLEILGRQSSRDSSSSALASEDGATKFALRDDSCYALHLTGEDPKLRRIPVDASCSAYGPPTLGLVSGFHAKGATIEVFPPEAKGVRFDLIAVPKSLLGGSCDHVLSADPSPLNPAKVRLLVDGKDSTELIENAFRIVASGKSDLVPGENLVKIYAVSDDQGKAYKCVQPDDSTGETPVTPLPSPTPTVTVVPPPSPGLAFYPQVVLAAGFNSPSSQPRPGILVSTSTAENFQIGDVLSLHSDSTCSGAPLASVTIGSAASSLTLVPTADLAADGTHGLRVKVARGGDTRCSQSAPAQQYVQYILDRAAPPTPVLGTLFDVNAMNSMSYTVSGTCGGDSSLITINATNGGGNATTTVTCTANTFSAALNLGALQFGTVTFNATATDTAGNASGPVSTTRPNRPVVEALYPAYPHWTQFVKKSDGTACVPSTPSQLGHNYFQECWHSGERLRVLIPGTASCTGLSMSDSVGWFDWLCDDTGGVVRFVTKRLRRGVGLRDLVNGSGWQTSNLVTLTGSLGTHSSLSSAWWTTPVEPLTGLVAGTARPLTKGGALAKVFVVTAPASSGTITLMEPNIALATLTGANVNFGTSSLAISVSEKDFVWIEGDYYGTTGAGYGVKVFPTTSITSSYVTLKNLRLAGFANGLFLSSALRPYLQDVTVAKATYAFQIVKTKGLLGAGIRAFNVSGSGIALDDSSYNVLQEVYVPAPALKAVMVRAVTAGSSYLDNVVSQLSVPWAGNYAVEISGMSVSDLVNYTQVINPLVFSGGAPAFYLNYATGSKAHNFLVDQSSVLSSANSASLGVSGYYARPTSTTCTATADLGLTCVPSGASATNVTDAHTFAANAVSTDWRGLATDYAIEGNDSYSRGTFDTDPTQWYRLGNPLRFWGPATMGSGTQCTSGQCWLYDFSLRTTAAWANISSHLSGAPPRAAGSAACPVSVAGNVTSSTSFSTGGATFLRHAGEIIHDDVGNNNGLCETGEECLYLPNAGAYQGHGPLQECTYSASGGLTNIRIFGHSTNGY